MKNSTLHICIGIVAAACSSCSVSLPDSSTPTATAPSIYPDYADVTIPQNIAPLNFNITEEGDAYVAHVHARDQKGMVCGGPTIQMDVDEWHKLLDQCVGDSVFIDVYVQHSGAWHRYTPVRMAVATPIDPYVSYRLIEPSYVNFEVMRVSQRCLENFDESDIFNTCTFAEEVNGQCINCHNPKNYNRDGEWQMHVRVYKGGTLIADGDQVKKVNLKTPQTISAGVYPAWHPSLPLIVYSNNNTMQIFHATDPNKIEVQDAASDIIMYDQTGNNVHIVANDSTEWETFPAWAPDGKALYYVSATVPAMSADSLDNYKRDNYKDIKYNIYRKSFDLQTRQFGATDTVYMASESGSSATLPRISPDGRYLLFTQAEYGTFHIWHHDADLYLMDLADGSVRPLAEANSDDTESYHTWSSDGRWIIFSSRRDDGAFTRLYITYFDEQGMAHKPFMLPQHNPDDNICLYKSYNVPELMVRPVETPRSAIIDAIDGDANAVALAPLGTPLALP